MPDPDGELSDLFEALDQLMRASDVISGVIAESIASIEVSLPQLRTLVLVAAWNRCHGCGAGVGCSCFERDTAD